MSNTRSRSSGGMPGPLSSTRSSTSGPRWAAARTTRGSRRVLGGGGQGVLSQVEQELPDLARVDPQERAAGAVGRREVDPARARLARQQLARLLQQVARRHLLDLERARPGVGEEVGHQVLEPPDLAPRDPEQPTPGRCVPAVSELFLEHLHVEVERVERVADLVGEARGQGADVGHALGLGRLLLELVTAPQQRRDEEERAHQQHRGHHRQDAGLPEQLVAQVSDSVLEVLFVDADPQHAEVADRLLDLVLVPLLLHLRVDQPALARDLGRPLGQQRVALARHLQRLLGQQRLALDRLP